MINYNKLDLVKKYFFKIMQIIMIIKLATLSISLFLIIINIR